MIKKILICILSLILSIGCSATVYKYKKHHRHHHRNIRHYTIKVID